MNPAMLALMGGGMTGGDSAPVNAASTAVAKAGEGPMTFGGGKTQSYLIFGVVALIAAILFLGMKGRSQ